MILPEGMIDFFSPYAFHFRLETIKIVHSQDLLDDTLA
jgi:hypothetical protein